MPDQAALWHAGRADLPAYERVRWMAVARANCIGHAGFGKGELRELLVNRETGVIPTTSYVAGVIKRGKELGLFLPMSNARCIVLPERLFRRKAYASRTCGEHGIW